MEKAQPWEYLAIDLIYLNKEPVTIALVHRDTRNMDAWIKEHVKPTDKPLTHIGVYAWPVTLH